jgi:hypothetical protein
LNCPRCGREIRDEAAIYCPYCANPLTAQKRRTAFPVAAGILTIIAACITLAIGVLSLMTAVNYFTTIRTFNPSPPPNYPPVLPYLIMGIFNVVAFAFGLAGGVCALRRRRFALSIGGAGMVLASAFVVIFSIGSIPYALFLGLLFAMPILILAILGVVFVAVSKNEFAQSQTNR